MTGLISGRMARLSRLITAACLAACATLAAPDFARAEPAHGIAMYGAPALPQDFVALPYANPDAPKGGTIIFGEAGSFDSLHPWIRKGTAPWGIGQHVAETLMGRSIDEPFTLYGLLAESIEVPDDRSWVEFTLRPEARFSDGSPVTVEDVMWSYETLGTIGHPRYYSAWQQVESMEQTGPRSVRFTFSTDNRELALLMGMRPILKKAQWEGHDFTVSGFDVTPIGSGPYVIDRVERGRVISFKRDPDYWGADVPFMRGQANFDEIRYEYFGDGDVVFEAFKAGAINTYREFDPEKWATQYDFPAVARGDVVKSEFPNQLPSGIRGLVMNTRAPVFADWRVREAMILAFNYEYISESLNGGRDPRITSYFSNSELGMSHGPAEGRVRELLEPFADQIPPGALEGYSLPEGDGSIRNRRNIARAMELMEEAGYSAADGTMRDAEGNPFTFEIVLAQSAANYSASAAQNMVDIYLQSLERMGIRPKVTVIDSAQYTQRTDTYDFDMTFYVRVLSRSPGTEQRYYWGSAGRDEPRTLNYMGVASPAIDAMISAMLDAESHEDFVAAVRALDRLLMAGRYVIPVWYSGASMIAHSADLRYPDRLPSGGAFTGFQPDVWWHED